MTLIDKLLTLGLPVGIVLGIIFALQYPKVIGQFLRLFGFAGQWVRRKSLTAELEGTVNSFINSFNSEFESPILPECKVEWVNDKNIEHILKSGKAIVKLTFSKSDHDLNFYNAAQAFIQTGFLNQTRPFLHKATSVAIDLLMTKILLVNHRRPALRIFNSRFSEQAEASKELFSKLEETEDRGLFRQIFVQELHYFGERLGSKSPLKQFGDEADAFLAWFYELATREEKELTRLAFYSEHLKIGVILVADREMYEKRGIRPYLRRAQQYATAGCHAVYILSRGSFHADIADAVVGRLVLGGGFRKLTKKTRVVKPDNRGSVTITCVSLKPDVMQIENNAWNDIAQDMDPQGCILGIIESVESNSVRVDVYGIKVDLSLTSLSILKLVDARRLFCVDQTLKLKVVRADRSNKILELSNVETETDPKHIIEEIEQIGTAVRKGTVINIFAKDGFEFALILQFEHRGSRLECYIPKRNATFSRFAALSEKYKVAASVEFTIEHFDSEKCSYIGKISGISDPWEEISKYCVGQRVSCVIRQINERHVTCEIVEGLEGSIFIEELSWDGTKENKRLIKSYKVGDTLNAAIFDIHAEYRRIALSVRRVSISVTEQFFESHKNQIVDAVIERVYFYYAEISVDDGRCMGSLLMRETFWSKDLRGYLMDGQLIGLRVLGYDFRNNKILFSLKGIQCIGFETIASSLSVGAEAVCEVLFCDDDRVTVLVMFESFRAHGYIYISEISNLIYFDRSLMDLVFREGTYWACFIMRYDHTNQIIELSRKAFLKSKMSQLNPADICQVQVLKAKQRGGGRRLEYFGYSDQVEGIFVNTTKHVRSEQTSALIASARGHVELSFEEPT